MIYDNIIEDLNIILINMPYVFDFTKRYLLLYYINIFSLY